MNHSIYTKKSGLLFSFFYFLVFAFLSVNLFRSLIFDVSMDIGVIFFISLLIFGVLMGTVEGWRDFFQAEPVLIISEDGIDVLSHVFIPWSAIAKIEMRDKKLYKSRERFCLIYFSNSETNEFKKACEDRDKQSRIRWLFSIANMRSQLLSIDYTRLAIDKNGLAEVFKKTCPSSIEIVGTQHGESILDKIWREIR